MSSLSYELELAKKRVNRFKDASDELMRDYAEAMQCRHCEEVLAAGIHAFHTIQRADQVLREAAREGIAAPDDAPKAVEFLYRVWLTPCDFVHQWIQKLAAANYRPDRLDEFNDACRQVREALAVIDSLSAIDAIHTEGF